SRSAAPRGPPETPTPRSRAEEHGDDRLVVEPRVVPRGDRRDLAETVEPGDRQVRPEHLARDRRLVPGLRSEEVLADRAREDERRVRAASLREALERGRDRLLRAIEDLVGHRDRDL